MGKSVDITGQKFNRLTAIKRTGEKDKNGWVWHCKCDCGNDVFTYVRNIRSNNTKSCGCLNIEKIKERNMEKRKYNFNLDYFDNMSNNLAYILGFFASDGTMIDGQWDIKFALSIADKEILEKIAEEIDFDGKVIEIDQKYKGEIYKSCLLRISSKNLYDKLLNMGFTNNKSYDVGIPKVITNEYMTHFIRGFFDGDGSIGGQFIKGSQQMRVRIGCGSEKIITEIRDWLRDNVGVKNVNINTDKRKNHWFEICYSTKDSLKLYHVFYEGSELYLKRKKDKFDELIQLRNIGQN